MIKFHLETIKCFHNLRDNSITRPILLLANPVTKIQPALLYPTNIALIHYKYNSVCHVYFQLCCNVVNE